MINNKILLVDTCYPINSRNKRIISSLRKIFGQENVKFATWLRDDSLINEDDNDAYIFKQLSPYANKFIKFRNLKKYYTFLKNVNNQFLPHIIIASHWDSLLLCSLIKHKHQNLIYENLDMPTGSSYIRFLLRILEWFSLSKTDAITVASRFYLPYYNNFKKEKIVLENKVPEGFIREDHKTNTTHDLCITFNGGLRYAEIMVNLIHAVGNLQNVKLKFYGGSSIGDGVKVIYDAAKKYSNIEFFGPYQYKMIPQIYSQTDVVWAVYPANDFNVKLAISNKYHESLFFGVPGIFAKSTKLGDFVEKNNSGFTVDGYSVSDIRSLIVRLRDNKELLNCVKDNLGRIRDEETKTWEEEFKNASDLILRMFKQK